MSTGTGSMMTVRTALGTSTRDELDEMAFVAGLSRSALIRQILEEATETSEAEGQGREPIGDTRRPRR